MLRGIIESTGVTGSEGVTGSRGSTGRFFVFGVKGERPMVLARHPRSARCSRKALRFRDDGTVLQIGGFPLCPDCGVQLSYPRAIRGTLAEDIKCGAKCREAFGLTDCRCSCDGANHASGWDGDR